jgi:hypothetical protein
MVRYYRRFNRRYSRTPRTRRRSKIMSSRKSFAYRRLRARVNTALRLARGGMQKLYSYQSNTDAALVNPYYSYNLIRPASNWTTAQMCWGYSAEDLGATNKITYKKIKIDFVIDKNNEDDRVDFTIFILKPKKACPSSTYNTITGTLTMNESLDYIGSGDGVGLTFINPREFDIIRSKRVSAANFLTSGGDASTWRTTWTIPMNNMIRNPHGNVTDLTVPISQTQQYILVIFNNNSSVDTENPLVSFNYMIEAECPN